MLHLSRIQEPATCFVQPPVVSNNLLCPTTCFVQPPVVSNHLLCPTTCCVQPPVVSNHLLCPTTCCVQPPVVSNHLLLLWRPWAGNGAKKDSTCNALPTAISQELDYFCLQYVLWRGRNAYQCSAVKCSNTMQYSIVLWCSVQCCKVWCISVQYRCLIV